MTERVIHQNAQLHDDPASAAGVAGTDVRKGLHSPAAPTHSVLGEWIVVAVFLVLFALVLTAEHKAGESPVRHYDFDAFYLAGKMVLHGEGPRLYDFTAQATSQIKYVDPTRVVTRPDRPFISPPSVALLFAPLALLPKPAAYGVWTAVNLLLVLVVLRLLPAPPRSYVIFVAIFAPAYVALLKGQMSILVLFLMTLAFYWFVRERPILAGLALGMATLKYQLVLGLLAIFMLRGMWSLLAGAAISGSFLAACAVFVSGWKGLIQYPALLRFTDHLPDVTNTATNVTLRGLMSFGFPQAPPVAIVAFASVVLIIVAALVAKRFDPSSAFCLALIVSMLTAFHAHTEELTLLLIPFALLQSRVAKKLIIALDCILVVLGYVALFVGLPVAFAAVCYGIVLFGLWKTRQPALSPELQRVAASLP